jgi:hypothetical protein
MKGSIIKCTVTVIINWYAYVDSDPVNRVDPDGMQIVLMASSEVREAVSDEINNAVEDPWGEVFDVAMIIIDIADGPSGEGLAIAAGRRAAKKELKELAKKAGKKAEDSSKAAKHGDAGRAIEKTKIQVSSLKDKAKSATTSREKKKAAQKAKNVAKNAEKKKRGTEHGRRGR